MNISKLLKITALSCIGLFSVNNNIVNASDEMDIVNASDEMDIDNENNYINDLTLGLNAMDINETEEVSRIKQIINNNRAILNREATGLNDFNNIVLSDGHIVFYFNEGKCSVFSDEPHEAYYNQDESPTQRFRYLAYALYVFPKSGTIQDMREKLTKYMNNYNFKAYKATTDNTGKIVSLKEVM